MKVLCKIHKLDDELAQRFEIQGSARPCFSLTVGKTYSVLSVVPLCTDFSVGSCSIIDVIDDEGRLQPAPSFFFEIVDATPSEHWVAFFRNSYVCFAHPDLAEDFFADDLSEGDAEAVRKWEAIKQLYS